MPEVQLADLRAYAKRRGLHAQEYVDEGPGGSEPRTGPRGETRSPPPEDSLVAPWSCAGGIRRWAETFTGPLMRIGTLAWRWSRRSVRTSTSEKVVQLLQRARRLGLRLVVSGLGVEAALELFETLLELVQAPAKLVAAVLEAALYPLAPAIRIHPGPRLALGRHL